MSLPYFMRSAASTSENGTSSWIETEEMKNYVHEAGHAVSARLTGFPVAWVSVDPAFIRTDPLAIENECNHGSAVCLTVSSDRLNPILNRRSALNKQDKETVVGYCIHVLAGPFSECRFDPDSFDPLPSMNDYGQVAQVLASVSRSDKVLNKSLFTAARRQLKKMLCENWCLVIRVAAAIKNNGTLSTDKLDSLIFGAEMEKAA